MPDILEDKLGWKSSDIVQASGGQLICGNPQKDFTGISIDTRTIQQGNLYVAIEGEKLDGHRFIAESIQKGAIGVMVDAAKSDLIDFTDGEKSSICCFSVTNTVKALGDLARFNRIRSGVSVAAITGSNGKTTTRKMATAVVSRRFSTLFPKKNFNNQIGVPLTLLNLRDHHQWAILELGTNQHGEIKTLTDICLPDLGVITNIGPAHLEGLGTVDGVMKEKGDLVKHLSPKSKAILNADDPRVSALSMTTSADVIFYGVSSRAHIRATDIEQTVAGIRFTVVFPECRIAIELSTPGYFMVSNALAAAAIGFSLNIDENDIKEALEKDFEPAPGRMNMHRLSDGICIIDDTYNANPGSMEAALRAFKALRRKARGALVIGDMLELGDHASELHYRIGALAVDLDISKIYAAGNFAADIAEGALSQGLDSRNISVGSLDHLLTDLDRWLQPNDWVLVKGSRGMKMEKIVDGLKQKRA